MFKRFWRWIADWRQTYQLWRSGAKQNCRNDLVQFADTFLPRYFEAVRQTDQEILLKSLQHASLRPGVMSIDLLRHGRGATTMVLAAILWNVAYGHRAFLVSLAWSHQGAKWLLRDIEVELESNVQLRRFFPHLRNRRRQGVEITFGGRIRIRCQSLLTSLRGLTFSPIGRHPIRPDLFIADDAEYGGDAVEKAMRSRAANQLSTFRAMYDSSVVRIQSIDE